MDTVLIVPGLHGSPPAHWQTWFEDRVAGCVRVDQHDPATPHLLRWAGAVREQLDRVRGRAWIVAHSFGCLAAAHAASLVPERIAGAMFVAPADPDRFGVERLLPDTPFPFPSVLIASRNDPWMRLMRAAWLADRWGSHLVNAGAVGHLNIDSGHGPWPDGLLLFEQLRRSQDGIPLGTLAPASAGRQRQRREALRKQARIERSGQGG
ncbi:alpha/beta hydrolase [Viridibacterium curvum]|uniref:Alpha/beta fold hydrolase n=1 Tax=Viridibacterium curvum TaxID=1101404 RepID=A0ABP9QN81_9RHOO